MTTRADCGKIRIVAGDREITRPMQRLKKVASPKSAVFRTAFGFPLYMPWAITLMQFVLAALIGRGHGWHGAALAGMGGLMATILVTFMLTTKYRVLDDVLHLRMGFWSRCIRIDAIKSLSEYGIKRGRVYGLGTDIVSIECRGRAVGITPKDLDGFVEALGVPLTRLGDGKPPS